MTPNTMLQRSPVSRFSRVICTLALACVVALLICPAIAQGAPANNNGAIASEDIISTGDAAIIGDSDVYDTTAPADVSGIGEAVQVQSNGELAEASELEEAGEYRTVAPFLITVLMQQDLARSMLTRVNALRAAEGAAPLVWDTQLEEVAILRAVESGVFFNAAHRRPTGLAFNTAYPQDAGVCGENVAYNMGFSDPVDNAFVGWVNSPGHHANMVNKNYTRVGIGCVVIYKNQQPYYYFTQSFADGTGTGMTGNAKNNYEYYTVVVDDNCVTKMTLDPTTVRVGVGGQADLPNAILTYGGTSSLGYTLPNYSCWWGPSYIRYTLDDNSGMATFVENKYLKGVYCGRTGGRAGINPKLEMHFDIVVSPWARLYGDNRYATASAISEISIPEKSCRQVILVTGDNFPDALAASGLAGLLNCPVVSAQTNIAMNYEALKELNRIASPDGMKVYVLGGTGAVNESGIRNMLVDVPNVSSVQRIAGSTRVETALIAYYAGRSLGTWSDTAIIACAETFPDALSISPYARASASPIFLAQGGVLNPAQITALQMGGFTKILIVGGAGAVNSVKVKAQLETEGRTFQFLVLAGSNRYETCEAILTWASGGNPRAAFQPAPAAVLSFEGMAVATGANFPDALMSVNLLGSSKSVLMLVDDSTATASMISRVVGPNKAGFTHGYLLGGPAVVSEAVADKLDAVTVD